MGVHGLWRLIEPSGKPVPLEALENKVLAVDVSIWLHQLVKGFQDSKGAPVPNAHLLGIYHRVCKLLYFRIKPVFVFDGGVPVLKKQTMAKRNQQKHKTLSEADRIHKNLLSTLLKHTAISKVLSEKAKAAITASTSPTKKSKRDEDNLYMLPPSSSLDSTMSSSVEDEGDESSTEDSDHRTKYDLHSIDTQSVEFKSLPVDVRHEILTDLKETRKQSSWGRIHELPTESDGFSGYQMRRLLNRQSVQSALEQVEKEMGGHSLSLGELEKILKDQGVITNNQLKGKRIASDENTRFLLIKDVRQAIEEAKKQSELPVIQETTLSSEETSQEETEKNKGDKEFEDDLEKAIAMSLEEEPSTSKQSPEENKMKAKNRLPLSFLSNFDEADFDDSESSEEEVVQTKFTSAQKYMIENSTLTTSQITRLIASKASSSKKSNIEVQEKSSKQNDIEIIDLSVDQKEENANNEHLETININEEESSAADNVEKDDSVQVMSDSESSNCDDFLDVDEASKANTAPAMEVVIKPDEEIEDDLFKDIFSNKENPSDAQNSEVNTKSLEESVPKPVEEKQNNTEPAVVDEKETHSNTLKDKIEQMIKQYSKPKDNNNSAVSLEQLNEMRDNLRQEEAELVTEKSSKERIAGDITSQMYEEAKELLELFGVPYLVAPMEAEAQCAFLELIQLTDGTITDDSDIWLFGGRTVYKNFFNQSKTVLEFRSESIHQNFKLTREQMILLAMLVGSDYTVGLTGVGPVTALEILAAFPPKSQLISGLSEFKSWFSKGKVAGLGRVSLRNKLKNLKFGENFPNPQIVQAYLEPQVETSKEKFTWGKPDVVGLVDFARVKFGWMKAKTDEILNPILKRLEDQNKQKSILDYFKRDYYIVGSRETEKKMSKRVQTAIERIGKGNGEEAEEERPKPKRVRKEKEPKTEGAGTKKRQTKAKKADAQAPKEGAGSRKRLIKNAQKVDEDIQVLEETKAKSLVRVEEIEKEVQKQIEAQKTKKVNLANLHKREVIPQKQKEKADLLRNKMKAIETFRKSKQGPGYVKKRAKIVKAAKEDASYLSDSSDSD